MAFRSLDRSGAYGGTLGMVCLACNAFTIPLQFSTRSCSASSRHRDRTCFLKPSHTFTCPSLGVIVFLSKYEFPLMTFLSHVILGCEVTATLIYLSSSRKSRPFCLPKPRSECLIISAREEPHILPRLRPSRHLPHPCIIKRVSSSPQALLHALHAQ